MAVQEPGLKRRQIEAIEGELTECVSLPAFRRSALMEGPNV